MLCIKENLSTTCIKTLLIFPTTYHFFVFAKLSKLLFDAMLNPSFNRKFKIMAQELLAQLQAGTAKFSDVLAHIEARYQHTPTAFQNGAQHNAATENQGSAKVFSFAKLQGLDQAQTLSLFAEHYASVLATPEGTDHQNIRQFMQNGWDGVKFEGQALAEKA
jgi:hypothetical protein